MKKKTLRHIGERTDETNEKSIKKKKTTQFELEYVSQMTTSVHTGRT